MELCSAGKEAGLQEIVWLTTHKPNVEFLTGVFAENQLEIGVLYSPLNDFFEAATSVIAEGTKVLISRGGAATELKKRVTVPVVDLKRTYIDFFGMIEKAYALTDRFALIGWYGDVRGFDRFREALGDSLRYFELVGSDLGNDEARIDEILEEVRRDGIRLVIGGGAVYRRAQEMGLQGIYTGLDREEALEAAEEARYLLRIAREQEYRYEAVSSIFNCVNDGIVSVDRQGYLTNINTLARQLLGVPAEGWRRRRLSEFITVPKLERTLEEGVELTNQIVLSGESRLVVSAQAIRLGGQSVGAVATLQRVDSIQKMENKIRASSIEKGLYAKKNFDDIVGGSEAMRRLKQKAMRFAATDSTVLITGESGTGKELFAQGIHNHSARHAAPFVALNCATLPESLLESELFGYVKGAFTGARNEGKPGVFELAHRGTLFLDEISEISPSVQARLLRVIQEKEVTRIGDDRVISVDVRILAASNKNLKEEIERGSFRSDLYYRLCVLPLHLCPLRERGDDVAEILRVLLRRGTHTQPAFTEGALRLLREYRWPGNVRELSNVAERLSLLYDGGSFDEAVVLEALYPGSEGPEQGTAGETAGGPRYRSSREIDRETALEALQKHHGSHAETARALGISTTTLWRRLREPAGRRKTT